MEKAEDNGIKVYLRVRPIASSESLSSLPLSTLSLSPDGTIATLTEFVDIDVVEPEQLGAYLRDPANCREHNFEFNGCLDQNTSQESVFNTCAKETVVNLLKGKSGAIIAYGQTGSGKTHTVVGQVGSNRGSEGMLPRAARLLVNSVGRDDKLGFSCFQLHNESIFDLLGDQSQPLQVKESSLGSYVDGLLCPAITSHNELTQCLQRALLNRRSASNSKNFSSSRSHAVFTFFLNEARVDFVDLAGSEKATAQNYRETGLINKSLSTFSKVILSLAKNQSHIPYRDSKLTRLLGRSLVRGGCVMLTCVSPAISAFSETLSTLKFADRVKSVKPFHLEADKQLATKKSRQQIFEENMRQQLFRIEDLHCERTLEIEKEFIAEIELQKSKISQLSSQLKNEKDANHQLVLENLKLKANSSTKSSRETETSQEDEESLKQLVSKQSIALAKMASLIRSRDADIKDLRTRAEAAESRLLLLSAENKSSSLDLSRLKQMKRSLDDVMNGLADDGDVRNIAEILTDLQRKFAKLVGQGSS